MHVVLRMYERLNQVEKGCFMVKEHKRKGGGRRKKQPVDAEDLAAAAEPEGGPEADGASPRGEDGAAPPNEEEEKEPERSGGEGSGENAEAEGGDTVAASVAGEAAKGARERERDPLAELQTDSEEDEEDEEVRG